MISAASDATADPPRARKKPGPPRGRKKPPKLKWKHDAARSRWWSGGYRERLATSIEALGGLSSLPPLIGGHQRGVVRTWIDATATESGDKRPAPEPEPVCEVLEALRSVAVARGLDLKALALDPELYTDYFAARAEPRVPTVCPRFEGRPGYVCPRAPGEVRWAPAAEIRAAEQRRRRRGLPGFPRDAKERVLRFCAACSREKQLTRARPRAAEREAARRGLAKGTPEYDEFVRTFVPQTRGKDKRPRRRGPKSIQHRENIRRGRLKRRLVDEHGVDQPALAKPFRLCPLCDLIVYAHEWHQDCWLCWKFWCEAQGRDPTSERPPAFRRRGPDPEEALARNYEALIAYRLRREPRAQIVARMGLTDPHGANDAVDALFAHAAGAWRLIFTKTGKGNRGRELDQILAEKLEKIVRSSARDPLIRRLHGYWMRPDKIARLVGASEDYVRRVSDALSVGRGPQPRPSWWDVYPQRHARDGDHEPGELVPRTPTAGGPAQVDPDEPRQRDG